MYEWSDEIIDKILISKFFGDMNSLSEESKSFLKQVESGLRIIEVLSDLYNIKPKDFPKTNLDLIMEKREDLIHGVNLKNIELCKNLYPIIGSEHVNCILTGLMIKIVIGDMLDESIGWNTGYQKYQMRFTELRNKENEPIELRILKGEI